MVGISRTKYLFPNTFCLDGARDPENTFLSTEKRSMFCAMCRAVTGNSNCPVTVVSLSGLSFVARVFIFLIR